MTDQQKTKADITQGQQPLKRKRIDSSVYWKVVEESDLRQISVGDDVFFKPKSAKELGKRGTVVELEDDSRLRVRFLENQQIKSCRRKRIISVLKQTGDCMVFLTPETTPYRQLAVSLVQSTNNVLEIGPSTGLCSNILHRYAKKWIAFETSQEMIDTCVSQQGLPADCLHKLDALQDPRRAQQLVENMLNDELHVVFIDIGGNREFDAVLRMTNWVLETFQPSLIVIKSRNVVGKIRKSLQSLKKDDYVPDKWLKEQFLELKRKLPQHPLQAPLSISPADSKTPICRYHNYHVDGCQKKHICEFDHDYCHLCLQKGHVARNCLQEE